MLKEHATLLRWVMVVFDLCLVAFALLLAYFSCDRFFLDRHSIYLYPFRVYIGYLPIVLVVWGILLRFFNMYGSLRFQSVLKILMILFKTTVTGFILFTGILYVLRAHEISRLLVGFGFLIAAVLIAVEKILLMLFLRRLRSMGFNYRNILIVGTGKKLKHFIEQVQEHSEWGLKIIGLIGDDPGGRGHEMYGYPVLGVLDDIPELISRHVVDDILFIVPHSWLNKIQEAMRFCEAVGVRISLAVDYFELQIAKARYYDFNGFPILTFESAPNRVWHLLFKRIFDIAISLFVLVFCSPLFLFIGILVAASSRGPIFFKQQRVGLNGRIFSIYKFRTMVVGAEQKLEELRSKNKMKGPVFKMTNDPRITFIGKFLRKWSLDELPQFWNVLLGQMSLVGPRPPLPSEVLYYDAWHRRRLSMRPGITCLWQVSGRNKITDFDRWMKLDLEYIDTWSLWLDFKILLKTIPAVLMRVGAE